MPNDSFYEGARLTKRETLNTLGGLSHQAYMLSTVDYFTLMGWVFAGLILLVWLACGEGACPHRR